MQWMNFFPPSLCQQGMKLSNSPKAIIKNQPTIPNSLWCRSKISPQGGVGRNVPEPQSVLNCPESDFQQWLHIPPFSRIVLHWRCSLYFCRTDCGLCHQLLHWLDGVHPLLEVRSSEGRRNHSKGSASAPLHNGRVQRSQIHEWYFRGGHFCSESWVSFFIAHNLIYYPIRLWEKFSQKSHVKDGQTLK